jgi:predicted nuclease of restriction endonuclease-like RecB superfamily
VATLPPSKLAFTAADGELVPAWLGDRDRPWLRDLLAAAEAFAGRPFADLARHWRRGERDPRAGRRQDAAVHVLERWLRQRAAGAPRRAARQQLFGLAAAGVPRHLALAQVAGQLGVGPAELAASLYDDLPERRRVVWPDPPPDPAWLAHAANTALVRGLLRHATAAELQVHGASRVLLKTAWLLGAAPAVLEEPAGAATLRWGDGARVVASLVPLLPWARRYRLRATCALPRGCGELVLATGDPLLPAPEPRPFDSALERELARALGRLLPDWEVVREPAVVATAHGLAFPDFELRPRCGGASWLCELAGLRDAAALPAKVALLARCPNLVLCLPERHVPAELRGHPRVVSFRRRVDAHAVRAAIAP